MNLRIKIKLLKNFHEIFGLGPNIYGWIESFFRTFPVRLNNIKGYILPHLGMPLISFSVEKGAVGHQDVLDPMYECLNEV